MRRHEWRVLGLIVGVSLTIGSRAHAQSITWLGVLPGYDYSYATGVSADGSIVSGICGQNFGDSVVGFRWTSSDGMQSLEHPDGSTFAWSVASHTDRIVGGLTVASEARAFYWDAGSLQTLFGLGGVYTMAYNVSADGSVIVGASTTIRNEARAVRWRGSTPEDLGVLSGRNTSSAYGVSADGSVIVGVSSGSGYNATAVRWTPDGIEALSVPSNWISSTAVRASADGDIVIGTAETDDGRRVAFRWNSSTAQDLGTLGGNSVFAYDITDDGDVVVGFSQLEDESGAAFRWTVSDGMENLNTTYAYLLTNGSHLVEARGISSDGRYIVGMGYNAATNQTEAFLLDTACTGHNGDVDASGCVDDADLLAVLFAFGSTGANLGRVDVNCDQTIDDADLLTVLFNFGSGC
jgi:probable HAF family extracellular repeat protein